MSAEYIYEGFKVTEGQLRTFFAGIPTQLDTTRIPLTVRYFNPTGFFASLGAMYVHQDIQNLRPNFSDMTATESADSENFVLVDAGLGYRLPKRLGLFSLEINNVLDKTFRFQDYGFNTTESTPPFVPERTLFARFTLNL